MKKTRREFPKAVLSITESGKFNRKVIETIIDTRCTKFSIVTVSEPKMNKTSRTRAGEDGKRLPNPYYGNVVKITFETAMAGTEYATRVNNQLAREGKESDFEPKPHAWGHHFQGSKSILQKNSDPNQLYLICYPDYEASYYESFYIDVRTNEEVQKHELEEYMTESYSAPKTQSDLDKKIDNYRNPGLDTVIYFKGNGVELVRDCDATKYLNLV